jgi:hypothetical protein
MGADKVYSIEMLSKKPLKSQFDNLNSFGRVTGT